MVVPGLAIFKAWLIVAYGALAVPVPEVLLPVVLTYIVAGVEAAIADNVGRVANANRVAADPMPNSAVRLVKSLRKFNHLTFLLMGLSLLRIKDEGISG